jgi:hypothetical protein
MMDVSIPKRELDDLIFLYEYEPTLHDLYVEGPFDASIIRWFVAEVNSKNINIYEIASVNIEREKLIAVNKKDNNRDKLLYLAEYFHEKLPSSNQVTCIIDKDFDHIIYDYIEIPCLLYTDFTCMEIYFYDRIILEKFLCINCNKSDWPSQDILTALSKVLQKMYLYRMANETLKWNMSRLNNIVCITFDKWELNFNEDDYINRLLNKNNLLAKKDEFLSEVNKLEPLLLDDVRFQIHGHDYIKLLCWYLKKKGIDGDKVNEKNTGRQLALSSSFDYLLNFELFNKIRKIVEKNNV